MHSTHRMKGGWYRQTRKCGRCGAHQAQQAPAATRDDAAAIEGATSASLSLSLSVVVDSRMNAINEQTQQRIASKTASQLRTLRVKDASPPPAVVPSSGSSTATSRSPSPPQEASTVNGHTTGRSNKLVLVPTTTSALGKRQLGGAGAAVVPIVSYPPRGSFVNRPRFPVGF